MSSRLLRTPHQTLIQHRDMNELPPRVDDRRGHVGSTRPLDSGESLPALEARVEAAPEDTEARLLLAASLVTQGAPESAEETLRLGIAVDPADVAIRLALGRLLNQSGRTQDALHQYRAVLTLNPDHSEASRMALTLHQRLARQTPGSQP